MNHTSTNRRRGFTLVEVLVTLAIFSLAVASLVAGLRSGVGAWQGVRGHQAADAAVLRVERTLRDDVRLLARMSKEGPALTEAAADIGGETINMTVLASQSAHRAAFGGVWGRVSYSVKRTDARDGLALVRTEIPFVGAAPFDVEPIEETLMDSVKSVRFGYFSQNELKPEWDNADTLPQAIEVTIDRDGAPTLAWTFWLPVGALESGSGSAQ